jgi:hypothetical protein
MPQRRGQRNRNRPAPSTLRRVAIPEVPVVSPQPKSPAPVQPPASAAAPAPTDLDEATIRKMLEAAYT